MTFRAWAPALPSPWPVWRLVSGCPLHSQGYTFPLAALRLPGTGGDSAGDPARARDPLADGEVEAGGEVPRAQSSGASALRSWPEALEWGHRV